MQYSKHILALAAALPFALAAPANNLQERATTQCGQYQSLTTGNYVLYQNLWGQAAGSGSQCSTLNSAAGAPVAWTTSWSWSGGSNSVKSYANAVVQFTKSPLSQIGSIPTTWGWSYTGSNIVADVSYDMFLGNAASGAANYEIMVWLAALGGAGPISSTGSPIATPNIGGTTFKLYKGPNGATTVFSFVAESTINNYSGDLMNFYTYLISSQGVSSAQYLQSIGAGTEPFTGSNAVLTTTEYTASVIMGTAKAAAVVPAAAAPATTAAAASGAMATSWAQCGGQGFRGPTQCVSGYKCAWGNQWYSQCVMG